MGEKVLSFGCLEWVVLVLKRESSVRLFEEWIVSVIFILSLAMVGWGLKTFVY